MNLNLFLSDETRREFSLRMPASHNLNSFFDSSICFIIIIISN